MTQRKFLMGVDIGGTFTDLVLAEEGNHKLYNAKTLTTPSNPAEGVLTAVCEALAQAGAPPGAVKRLVHGTTLATNLILERTGAKVGYVATEGFGDIFLISKQRPTGADRYNTLYEQLPPLASRAMVCEVRERVNAAGEILVALDEEKTEESLRGLAAKKPDAVAICLLHSYVNPVHEQKVAQIARRLMPQAYITTSSDIWPAIMEYERAHTTLAAAYVGPVLANYLENMAQELRAMGIDCGLQIMQSSGAVMPAATAARKAIYSLESGPAAGVLNAAYVGRLCTLPNIISFDMGGTTAKVGLVRNGKLSITHDFKIGGGFSTGARSGGEPIKIPVIDLTEVGAGGGSIAWVDDGGFLKVGPRSAGAKPGPACYGFGGDQATVTDANVILGYLNPEYFLGGKMRIYPEKSREAISRQVAQKLKLDVVQAARGIYELANARMSAAVRIVTLLRGIDPRDFAMCAFGGAGPIHVVNVAEQYRIPVIIIPPSPGVASAFGLLVSDLAYDYVTTKKLPALPESTAEIKAIFEYMEQCGRQELAVEGFADCDVVIQRTIDVSFVHQKHSFSVPAPAGPIDQQTITAAEESFRKMYQELFGVTSKDPCKFVNFGIRALGLVPNPKLIQQPKGDGNPKRALKGRRRMYFSQVQDFVETPVYDRTRLQHGDTFKGPVTIEEPDSTTVCPPGYDLQVDAYLNLAIRRI